MWSPADGTAVHRAAVLHAVVLFSARRPAAAALLREVARGLDDEDRREDLVALAGSLMAVGVDAAAAKELRELEDRLGVSPLSRRRLQWELVTGTGKTDPETAAPKTDSTVARRTSTGNVLAALSS